MFIYYYYNTIEELQEIMKNLGIDNTYEYSYIEPMRKPFPWLVTHDLKNGYCVNLKKVPVKGSVEVYMLNKDGTVGEKLKYGKHKSKYRYSLSGSILTLPSYLNKNESILIKCLKKPSKDVFERTDKAFPLPKEIHIRGLDKSNNTIRITVKRR